MCKFIIKQFNNFVKPQKQAPKYTGPYAEIWEALDTNRDAGRLVVAI